MSINAFIEVFILECRLAFLSFEVHCISIEAQSKDESGTFGIETQPALTNLKSLATITYRCNRTLNTPPSWIIG